MQRVRRARDLVAAHRLGVAMIVALGACIAASLATGTPAKLPGAALHSTVVFHAERTVVLLIAVLFGVAILARSWRGELPIEFSSQGLKYAVEEVKDSTQQGF